MRKKILILNYNTGNYSSIINLLRNFDCQFEIGRSKKQIDLSDVIIFPGVGTFPEAMNIIKKQKIDKLIKSHLKKGKYIFGICLGMQLFAEISEEILPTNGLKLISGKVRSLSRSHHIGWNKVFFSKSSVFQSLNKKEFYFQHKFHLTNCNSIEKGFFDFKDKKIIGVIKNKNITGVQFHPEKSQNFGNDFFKIYLDTLDV